MTLFITSPILHAGKSSSLKHVIVGATDKRMAGPDILRSLAILLVMLVHLPRDATPHMLVSIREYGWLGVDIFFVLSGYLIGTQLFKEISFTGLIDFKSFYVRRAFRILPAFFVVLALYVLVPAVRDSPNMQPLWKFVTFTVNLGFDPREGNAFSQAWTLAVEEQFYLVLPLLVFLLYRHIGMRWILASAGVLTLGAAILRYTIWDDQVGSLIVQGQFRHAFAAYLRDIYYPTYTRFDGLLFGVLLAAARVFKPAFCRQYMPAKATFPFGLMFVVAALACFVDRGPLKEQAIISVFQAQLGATTGFPLIAIGIALLLSAILDIEHKIKRWQIPVAAFVATLSYSLYLTHKSVFHVVGLVFGEKNLQGNFGFTIYIVASLAIATLLWLCVERPFLRLRDRLLQHQRTR